MRRVLKRGVQWGYLQESTTHQSGEIGKKLKFSRFGSKMGRKTRIQKFLSPIFDFYGLINPWGHSMSIGQKPEVSKVIW